MIMHLGFKMMFFGTGVIYLSIGFLFWFWFGDHSTGYIWRQVILRGWSSTAASLLVEPIRIVIGAQQVIGTSMLAAIALEGGAVTILKAPAVSILRYTNTGPMDLWPSFYFGWKARKGWSINLALGMIIPMVVSFWASQFMSPMILVDIHPEVIVGEEVVTLVSEGLANLEAGMVNYANRKVSYSK